MFNNLIEMVNYKFEYTRFKIPKKYELYVKAGLISKRTLFLNRKYNFNYDNLK